MTHPLLMSLFDEAERRPLSISELTDQVRGALEGRFASVWVEGEISNFKAHTSGHWYFTVKDEASQLRATCFRATNARIRFRPSNGLQVRARGRLTVYAPRGEYELVVEALDPVGAGALRVAFEQLRERLGAEGLFADELKRPLPLLPRRVGVVTSPDGAAFHDIRRVISERTRTVNLLLAPTRVQGEGAGAEIAAAIALLNEHHAAALAAGDANGMVDVIIVGRGGGSTEDLWAFNEEEVARAIRASRIPVISAVGHETDVTIADFAADVRAPTPSAAAMMVAEREDQLEIAVFELTKSLAQTVRLRLLHERARVQRAAMSRGFDDTRARVRAASRRAGELQRALESLAARAVGHARARAGAVACRLTPLNLSARLANARIRHHLAVAARDAALRGRVNAARARVRVAVAELDALSPLGVLQRGYALAADARRRLLRDAGAVKTGEQITLRLAKGTLRCRVEGVE
ncbi:MAG TPA: exodeoxyribonuclease VII large subunit [Pyrinomonadaceae bacterium]|nr:exodeoxyribonuclease VII large subunit [Pyrinomonadaceae bacterium]